MRRLARRVGYFIDRHASKLALAVALIVAVGTVLGVEAEQRDRTRALEAEAEARSEADARQAPQICEAFRLSQEYDRLLIEAALSPRASGNSGLLSAPSFDQLPPIMQQYLREIAAPPPTTEPPPGSLAERLRELRDERLGPDDLPSYCLEPEVLGR